MKSYFLPGRFFKKKWVWFEDPHDVNDADMVTFFSYSNVEAPGFMRSAGITSVIDLRQPLQTIWEKMRKDFIRLQIERGSRQGIIVKQDDSFDMFRAVLEEFRASKGLQQQDYSVFREHGILFSAYLNGEMIAGGIFIGDEAHLRVWMLASKRLQDKTLKQRVGEANRMILWEAIKYAKEHDMALFDFCGLDMPEKEGDAMPSLTVYKEAFGGERRGQYYYTKIYSLPLRLLIQIKNAAKL